MASNFKDLISPSSRSGSHSQQLRVLESAARAVRGAYANQIQGMVERLLDAMFRYAESTTSAEDSRRVLSAYGVLYEHRIPFARLLESKIQSSLNQTIDDFLNNRQTTPGIVTTPKKVSLDELSLVETSDMDRMVVVSNLAKRIESAHYEPFNELNARLAALVGMQDINPSSNPFRAEFLLQAIEEAWTDTRTDPNHDRVLIERSTPQILGDYGALLRAANEAFQRFGIGPAKFGVATALNRPAGTTINPQESELPPDEPSAETAPAPADKPGFFKRVQQLLTRQLGSAKAVPPVEPPMLSADRHAAAAGGSLAGRADDAGRPGRHDCPDFSSARHDAGRRRADAGAGRSAHAGLRSGPVGAVDRAAAGSGRAAGGRRRHRPERVRAGCPRRHEPRRAGRRDRPHGQRPRPAATGAGRRVHRFRDRAGPAGKPRRRRERG
ncbi:DUF1631 family protein [Derxia gummosa]|uniref:DUF1631 family protein n=1 Tax=Derxia gummosa DSM 723 TaxID=1121388 RepID=A0A9U5GGJ5_9BURK|nr:DUF1631 family protein [Derxia gummosa]